MRFPAAALAAFGHTYSYFGAAGVGAIGTLWASLALNQGVSFFFILSGFILMHVYPSLNLRGARRFLVARVARIWPMHIVALIIPIFILPRQVYPGALHLRALLFNFSLLQMWTLKPVPSTNSVSWSLSVEFFFYVVFPLLLWRWRQTWWAKLILTLLITVGIVLIIDYRLHQPPRLPILGFFVNALPIVRLFEFTLGMATATLWRVVRPRIALGVWRATLVELAVVALVFVVMACSSTWADQATHTHWIATAGKWEEMSTRSPWIGLAASWWLRSSGFIALPFAALIFVMALEQGWISRLLAFSPLVLLGEISYSLYLLHPTLVDWYALHPIYFMHLPDYLRYPLFWVTLILASYLSWSIVEVPSRRIIVGQYDRVFGVKESRRTLMERIVPTTDFVRSRFSFTAPSCRRTTIVAAVCLLIGTYTTIAAAPPRVGALNKAQEPPHMSVDYFGGIALDPLPTHVTRAAFPTAKIPVAGWAIDFTRHTVGRGVFICVDGKMNLWTPYGYQRPDVASVFEDERFLRSGYSGEIPLDKLVDGAHSFTIRMVYRGSNTYVESRPFSFVLTS